MKEAVRDLAVFWGFAMAIMMSTIWFGALAYGGRVSFSIDAFGEMWLEYALWFVMWPIMALGFHYYIEQVW